MDSMSRLLPTLMEQSSSSAVSLVLGGFVLVSICPALILYNTSNGKTSLLTYLRFAYVNFLKPHRDDGNSSQQSALEGFYSAQANFYDATRKWLLRGREDMLSIMAAQLRKRNRSGSPCARPIWYDVGGGTGYNIEVMDDLIDIQSTFAHVYLVDLSPSLCEIAKGRVTKFGWKNVTVLCQDARTIPCQPGAADLITMSYSLSMIPDFYGVVDLLTNLLAPAGMIGICDFYVQSIVDVSSRNYVGGTFNRHVNWLGRMFWRAWFDADRVNLDGGRRDYVEYRFGTILSASERNYWLGAIPYYIFVGCRRDADRSAAESRGILEEFNAVLTESPYLSPNDYRDSEDRAHRDQLIKSKSYESAIVNLNGNLPLPATFYQKHPWRIHYNDLLHKHQQFGSEYIYAFNWEDPKVDMHLLNIRNDDVILTITSAGDNVLDYLLEQPHRIHAVDLNPNQNHLLELKAAAFTVLPHIDVWKLFGEGNHARIRELLIEKLSPHLSSAAFQYWLSHTDVFTSSRGLYESGGSRHAIQLVRRLFRLFGLSKKVNTMCSVDTLNEQRELWPKIRDVLLSWPLHYLVVSTEWWAWKAAGVPANQHKLIVDDYAPQSGHSSADKRPSGEAIWQYIIDTLDPIVQSTQLSCDNYFYYLCLQGKYSKKCHPRYLDSKAYTKLSQPGAFDGLRIHTDEIMEVIARMSPASLTIAILMDSMDWFDPNSAAARDQIVALNKVLKFGGRVLFRSAARRPWYASLFEQHGFQSKCVGLRTSGRCIDRVNMYASTWICTKTLDITRSENAESARTVSLEEIRI